MKSVVSALAVLCMLSATPAWCMKIGVLPAADALALYVAAEEGLFTRHGLDVDIVPFQSAIELAAAVRAGALDGFFGDIINVALLHEGGVPQAIVATTSHAAGVEHAAAAPRHFGVALAPGSRIRDVSTLAGAKVAIGRATIVDFLLDAMLARAGQTSGYVQHVDIRQIPVRLQMLLAGQIDAAVLPEPLLSLVEAQGATVLLDDRGLGLPLAVVALAQAHATPERVEPLQRALAEAMRRINEAPEHTRTLMTAKGLLPKGAHGYRMVRFDPAHCPYGLPDNAAVEQVLDWMRAAGVLRTRSGQAATGGGMVYGAPASVRLP